MMRMDRSGSLNNLEQVTLDRYQMDRMEDE